MITNQFIFKFILSLKFVSKKSHYINLTSPIVFFIDYKVYIDD